MRLALANDDLTLLSKVNGTIFFTTPSEEDVKRWGKYFLDAYARDAGWLVDTKKPLERIKADAQELLNDTEINGVLKERIKRILAASQEGLIVHV